MILRAIEYLLSPISKNVEHFFIKKNWKQKLEDHKREDHEIMTRLHRKMFGDPSKLREIKEMINDLSQGEQKVVCVLDPPYSFGITKKLTEFRQPRVMFKLTRNDLNPLTQYQINYFIQYTTWLLEKNPFVKERALTEQLYGENDEAVKWLKQYEYNDTKYEVQKTNVPGDTLSVDMYLDLVSELKLAPLIIEDDASIVYI